MSPLEQVFFGGHKSFLWDIDAPVLDFKVSVSGCHKVSLSNCCKVSLMFA